MSEIRPPARVGHFWRLHEDGTYTEEPSRPHLAALVIEAARELLGTERTDYLGTQDWMVDGVKLNTFVDALAAYDAAPPPGESGEIGPSCDIEAATPSEGVDSPKDLR